MRAAARWALLLLLMTALVAALAAQGLSTRTTGASRTPRPGSPKGQLAGSRPILIWNGRRLESREGSPGRRIALTFDDGPDPTWTPRIAAALRRLHVPATFFVIGSKVARHPELSALLYREGFEIGNHTFMHVDLAAVPTWERRRDWAVRPPDRGAVRLRTAPRAARRQPCRGGAVRPAGVDRDPRLRRGGRDRARHSIAGGERVPRARGARRRRRLDRRDGGASRATRARGGAGRPAAEPGQARGSQPRDRRRASRRARAGGRGYRLRAGDAASARPAI